MRMRIAQWCALGSMILAVLTGCDRVGPTTEAPTTTPGTYSGT
jgi:hypothetical protein